MRAPPPSWDDTTPAGAGAAGPLAGAVADKLRRLSARGAAQADEAWRWIQALHEEDPECAQAVAERLDLLMARLSAGGLGRWVLAGLRRHERAPAAQRLFPAARSLCARGTGEAAARELEALQAPLSYLLTGLSRRAMTVEPQRRQSLFGPPSRPILTATHLLAPDSYTVLDGADRWALCRAAVAHAAAHRLYSRAAQPTGALKPLALAVVSAIEDARVERLLCAAFPARAAGSALRAAGARSRRPELRRAGAAAGPRADGSGSGR